MNEELREELENIYKMYVQCTHKNETLGRVLDYKEVEILGNMRHMMKLTNAILKIDDKLTRLIEKQNESTQESS
jgi:hypothetical protein